MTVEQILLAHTFLILGICFCMWRIYGFLKRIIKLINEWANKES